MAGKIPGNSTCQESDVEVETNGTFGHLEFRCDTNSYLEVPIIEGTPALERVRGGNSIIPVRLQESNVISTWEGRRWRRKGLAKAQLRRLLHKSLDADNFTRSDVWRCERG